MLRYGIIALTHLKDTQLQFCGLIVESFKMRYKHHV